LRQFFVHQLHHRWRLAASDVADISLRARCCGLRHILPSQYYVSRQMHRICAYVCGLRQLSAV